jgi:hypothetical protein
MKGSTLLSLFCIMAAAAPLTGGRPNLPTRDIPNYPGIRFDSNGKLSISVFSDLHFGERELHLNWFRKTSLANSQQLRARRRTPRQHR